MREGLDAVAARETTRALIRAAVVEALVRDRAAILSFAPRHRFQVLTKRSARMRAWFDRAATSGGLHSIACAADHPLLFDVTDWPLPNVWLGVSVEDQAAADARVPDLLATPAALRFLSCEPLLGPVNIVDAMWAGEGDPAADLGARIDWVIAGGESGRGSRPMHPDWARSLRDQCAAAGVPFFFKQWGEHVPCQTDDVGHGLQCFPTCADAAIFENEHCRRPVVYGHGGEFWRVGKAHAGRLLDGVEHSGMPA